MSHTVFPLLLETGTDGFSAGALDFHAFYLHHTWKLKEWKHWHWLKSTVWWIVRVQQLTATNSACQGEHLFPTLSSATNSRCVQTSTTSPSQQLGHLPAKLTLLTLTVTPNHRPSTILKLTLTLQNITRTVFTHYCAVCILGKLIQCSLLSLFYWNSVKTLCINIASADFVYIISKIFNDVFYCFDVYWFSMRFDMPMHIFLMQKDTDYCSL